MEEQMTERLKVYSPAVKDKMGQAFYVASVLRPLNEAVLQLQFNQVITVSKKLEGQKLDTKFSFGVNNIWGLRKVFTALIDDLIDMGAPEATGEPTRYLKRGDVKPLTEEEEQTAKRILEE